MEHQGDVFRHVHEVRDVAAQDAKAWVAEQVSDVADVSGEEVVQADDLDTSVDQPSHRWLPRKPAPPVTRAAPPFAVISSGTAMAWSSTAGMSIGPPGTTSRPVCVGVGAWLPGGPVDKLRGPQPLRAGRRPRRRSPRLGCASAAPPRGGRWPARLPGAWRAGPGRPAREPTNRGLCRRGRRDRTRVARRSLRAT